MLHGCDLFAVTALTAGNTGLEGSFAVQGLSKAQGEGAAAGAGRSREEIGVAHCPMDDVLLQHVHGPFVTGEVPVIRHWWLVSW